MLYPDPKNLGRFHYAGISGSGMSALAQFQIMTEGSVSGSDRAFDRGEQTETRAMLEKLGITIFPQDGSGINEDCKALVVSTAVEEKVLDFAIAQKAGVPIIHRSELLSHYVANYRTVAVGGTSGKSTVVAMIFEILQATGHNPSIITGGNLVLLEQQGLIGNAWFGGSDILVVEADESDGSIVRYEPSVGVVLNLSKDHKEPHEIANMFMKFRDQTRESFVVGEGENLMNIATNACVFGFGSRATIRAKDVILEPSFSLFFVDNIHFKIPVPGRHNVENALAAIAACYTLGVSISAMVQPLTQFRGVNRRFQSLGIANGVEVVDDFAHNPAKVHAAIETAQRRASRVLAIYQPHGFSPTRFLRKDFVNAFTHALRPNDKLWLLEIYYAGGTAQRDFSANDIVLEIAACGKQAGFAPPAKFYSNNF